ncbi:MAG: hypothetical protein IJK60_05560 [Clostridia bacterium]|nr:hypothetical protein [Clostridia bacterium]
MIDNENKIIQAVKTALETDYPDVPVYSITTLAPETFPCVSIEEADNYIYKKAMTNSSFENMDIVMYEVNVFSNKASGKKQQAKSIFQIIDSTLLNLGFIREYTKPVSFNDGTAYRFTGRFKGYATKS